jgi:transcriptional regulator with XRE-family HTH domain
MSFGERIAKERKRLGLSQGSFAELLGVSLSTQKRYEKGEREPDLGYLQAIDNAGFDYRYIMTGIREIEEGLRDKTACMLLYALLEVLGLKRNQVDELLVSAIELEKNVSHLPNGHHLALRDIKELAMEVVADVCFNDLPAISAIIEGFEAAIQTQGLAIGPAKKGQAITMLYRAFMVSGKIDQAMIEDAVKLAAD